MLQIATQLFFPALMAFAAFSDLFTMTISNRVSILLTFLFIALAIATGLSMAEISWHLASGALTLVIGFTLFALGWIGGGDAKLAAATAIWLGFDQLGQYALVASLFGGILTLLILGLRYLPMVDVLANRAWILRLHNPGTGIPYGIALACAGLFLYPASAIWLAAAAQH